MMRKSRSVRTCQAIGSGAVLLQITACFGPDPQLFFTSTITNAVVSNLVSFLFNTLTAGLNAA